MGTILLTSAGFLNPKILEFVKARISKFSLQSVAIITTAAEGKENNKYSQLAHKQLSNIGLKEVTFFDLETEDTSSLSKYDIFYVCGGNTFKLLKFANISNFKEAILALINRNGMYIGVSAGSLIIGSSVEIANVIKPDPNEIGLSDFTGLNIWDILVYPHYEVHDESEIGEFEKKHNTKVTRITNDQAVLISDGKSQIIE